MASLTYLLFNVAVATSLIGAVLWTPRLWRNWRGLVIGLVIVSGPFIIWDMLATAAGHWSFNPIYTLGWQLGELPVEELLFFVTVPLGCMVAWELLRRTGAEAVVLSPRQARWIMVVLAVMGASGVWLAGGNQYTQLALLSLAVASVTLALNPQLVAKKQWWWYQLVGLGLFFVSNSILTGVPVVQYGSEFIIGWRVGTIPVEDFWYNFALLNLFLVAYEYSSRRQKRLASGIIT